MISGLQRRERLTKVEGFMPHCLHPVQPHSCATFYRQMDYSRKPSLIAVSQPSPGVKDRGV